MTEPPPHFLIPPGEPFTGEVILARFVLLEPVGEGGQGVVWRATERGTDLRHAVKFVRPQGGERDGVDGAARREVAALRLLAVPGVVRLIDAGQHVGRLAIVMEWVDGRPFPGPRDGARWADLARPVAVVLESLRQLHGVGLVHRDVKPSNVLLQADGTAVLLDLGVAGGAALGAPRPAAGTPRFLPPEARFGATPAASDDLFALGVMVFEALAADVLRRAPGDDAAALARDAVLARLAGRAPHEVASLVAALVALDPRERISSADEALAELTGTQTRVDEVVGALFAAHGLQGSAVSSSEAYRALFDARERIVDDRGHAARALFALAGGDLRAARREVRAWLQAGIGRVVDSRVRLLDHDIERVLQRRAIASPRARALAQAVLGVGGADEEERRARLAPIVTDLGRLVDAGVLEGVLAEAPVALALAIDVGDPDAYDVVAEIWLLAAIARNDGRALEALLFALERDGVERDAPRAVVALARAGVAAIAWATDRVRAVLEGLTPPSTFRLRFVYHAISQMCARSAGPEAAFRAVEAARVWAETTGRDVPAVATWEGWAHYAAGDFARAVDAHLASARGQRGEYRMPALLAAGLAADFADRPAVVLACAREVQALPQDDRNVFARVRARMLELDAQYGAGERLVVDEDLVTLLRLPALGLLSATGLLRQAAIAWRTGDTARAAALAEEAERTPRGRSHPSIALLLRAFRMALGVDVGPWRSDDFLAPEIVAGYRLQAAALLAKATPQRLLPFSSDDLASAWAEVRARDLGRRREVLSLRECRDLLAARGVQLESSVRP